MCLHVLCFGSLLLLGQVRVELIGTKVQECKTALVIPAKNVFVFIGITLSIRPYF